MQNFFMVTLIVALATGLAAEFCSITVRNQRRLGLVVGGLMYLPSGALTTTTKGFVVLVALLVALAAGAAGIEGGRWITQMLAAAMPAPGEREKLNLSQPRIDEPRDPQ